MSIDSNYEVYLQFKDSPAYKSILYGALKFNQKKIVSIVYDIAFSEYKKFILILNATINVITLRVYSTGKNSNKFVDVAITFELILNCTFNMLSDIIKTSVKQAIELTIKEMTK